MSVASQVARKLSRAFVDGTRGCRHLCVSSDLVLTSVRRTGKTVKLRFGGYFAYMQPMMQGARGKNRVHQ